MSAQDQQDQRYQGWANYPTWAVNLWMANDEDLYREALSYAEDVFARGEDGEATTGTLASIYRDWMTDLATLDEASFRSDLLGWAMQHVDWHEIAASWLDGLEI